MLRQKVRINVEMPHSTDRSKDARDGPVEHFDHWPFPKSSVTSLTQTPDKKVTDTDVEPITEEIVKVPRKRSKRRAKKLPTLVSKMRDNKVS